MKQHLKTAGLLLAGALCLVGTQFGGELYVRHRLEKELTPVFQVFDARLQKLEGVAPVGSQ